MVLVRLKKGRGKGVETGAPAGAQKRRAEDRACFGGRAEARGGELRRGAKTRVQLRYCPDGYGERLR